MRQIAPKHLHRRVPRTVLFESRLRWSDSVQGRCFELHFCGLYPWLACSLCTAVQFASGTLPVRYGFSALPFFLVRQPDCPFAILCWNCRRSDFPVGVHWIVRAHFPLSWQCAAASLAGERYCCSLQAGCGWCRCRLRQVLFLLGFVKLHFAYCRCQVQFLPLRSRPSGAVQSMPLAWFCNFAVPLESAANYPGVWLQYLHGLRKQIAFPQWKCRHRLCPQIQRTVPENHWNWGDLHWQLKWQHPIFSSTLWSGLCVVVSENRNLGHHIWSHFAWRKAYRSVSQFP